MSTLTSHHNARVNKVLLFSALVIGVACSVAAMPQKITTSLIATAKEIHEAELRLPAALKNQEDLPDSPLLLKIQSPLMWSSDQDTKRLLAPVHVRYHGLTNSYCRLVTVSSNFNESDLIALPSNVNFDNCMGMSKPLYFDINGDGHFDLVQRLRVQSNRYDAIVEVPVIYLSDTATKGGYCYSETASTQIGPPDMGTVKSVTSALEKAKQRLGIAQFECSK
jgi:hypothetical protein